MDRRTFLQAIAASGGVIAIGGAFPGALPAGAEHGDPYGPMLPPDANGLRLPEGFTSRVVATTGQPVGDTGHVWHEKPDGGETFPTPSGGWIYVSNSEFWSNLGGVGAIEFDADGAIVAARTILSGTNMNCAGGATPWGTWLSCEEHDTGIVWECDPTGVAPAVARPAMGAFYHEAAAVDPVSQVVYLTEDRAAGGLYRFVPTTYPDLSSGVLEVLADDGTGLTWVTVPDPSGSPVKTRHQVASMVPFNGGEGAYLHAGVLWFTTKGDGRVWTYDTATNVLAVAYDEFTASRNALSGVDNVTVDTGSGDVFVAEDGGNMQICVLVHGDAIPFLELTGVTGSEITGPAFNPDRNRLYFSSQENPGVTYEVTGPFRGAVPPPPPPPPPFECHIDPATKMLTWTDQGQPKYRIRRNYNGTNRQIGTSTTTSFKLKNLRGVFTVRYIIDGVRYDATCTVDDDPPTSDDPPAGDDPPPSTPPFECQIDPATKMLTWTDQGQPKYRIRRNYNGTNRQIGTSTTTSFKLKNLRGVFTVRYIIDGVRYDATCTAPT